MISHSSGEAVMANPANHEVADCRIHGKTA